MSSRSWSPLLLLVACSPLLACSSDPDSGSDSSNTTETPTAQAILESAGAADPQTVDGAREGAQRWMDLYAAGDYAAAWELLTQTGRNAVSQDDYVQGEQACDPDPGTPFTITNVQLHDTSMAMVTWTRGSASGNNVIRYEGGQWRWELSVEQINRYGQGVDVMIASC